MKSSEVRLAEIMTMHEDGVRLNRKDRRTLEKAKRSGLDTTLPEPEVPFGIKFEDIPESAGVRPSRNDVDIVKEALREYAAKCVGMTPPAIRWEDDGRV